VITTVGGGPDEPGSADGSEMAEADGTAPLGRRVADGVIELPLPGDSALTGDAVGVTRARLTSVQPPTRRIDVARKATTRSAAWRGRVERSFTAEA
jgi:hypothetical protein